MPHHAGRLLPRDRQRLIERYHRKGRNLYAITPRFAVGCTAEMMERCRQLKEEHTDCWINTHISENPPELTEERRKDYIKMAKGKAEDGRVSVRNIRRNAKQALEKLEKDGEVGKDDVTGAEKRLDGITKKHTDEIDEMLKHKEAELLEV